MGVSNYNFGNFSNADNGENKRLLGAILFSVMFLAVWNFFTAPSEEELAQMEKNRKKSSVEISIDGTENGDSVIALKNTKNALKVEKKKEKKEIFLQNDKVNVGFDIANNRMTFYALKHFKQHEKSIKNITLLDDEHFFETGWLGDVKNNDIKWQVKSKTNNSIVLIGNYNNFVFENSYFLNDDYTVRISKKVVNNGSSAVSVADYSRISEKNTTDRIENIGAFRGVLFVNEDKVNEFNYDKIAKNTITQSGKLGSWIGFSDQYWITALASKNKNDEANISYSAKHGNRQDDIYQVDFCSDLLTLKSGEKIEKETLLIVAPKKLELLQDIEKKYGLQKFDKAIDFGMFYFLSKPLLIILKRLNSISGNFGVAIILLTILVRMIIFPLANRSYRVSAKMKKIAPQIEEVRKRCGDDKKTLQTETYKIYKDNNVNPMSAIFPLLLQIPIFFALYKVLVISIEMRDAPFIGWIIDLSTRDPSSVFNLFGLLNFEVPAILQIGLLPCLMGLTMFIQQKLNPMTGIDPTQAKMMKFFPVIFTIMFASMPAGLVLYWICSNIFTIIQQGVLIKIVNREK